MKFYSEKLNKFFNTEKECRDSEDKFNVEASKLKCRQNEKTTESKISNEKKELSKKFEEADAKLNEAYDKYEIAKNKAKDVWKEAAKECEKILSEAEREIKEKQQVRANILSEFNSKFGAYTKIYTGDKAVRESARINNMIDRFFNIYNNRFWW